MKKISRIKKTFATRHDWAKHNMKKADELFPQKDHLKKRKFNWKEKFSSMLTDKMFKAVVKAWFVDQAGVESIVGEMKDWDVSNITDMEFLFMGQKGFDEDLSKWDMGSVTNIHCMFCDAVIFNQKIGSWNVGKVVEMSSVFWGASEFDQDISSWNVSSAIKMDAMFADATSFNQNLKDWDVARVQSMWEMFAGATSFNQDLNDWNIDQVVEMDKMFYNATSFSQTLCWNVTGKKTTQMFNNSDGAIGCDTPPSSSQRLPVTMLQHLVFILVTLFFIFLNL